jgi:hypothetical protein
MEWNQAQVIAVSLTSMLAAISIGYLGVLIFGRNTMYTIATDVFTSCFYPSKIIHILIHIASIEEEFSYSEFRSQQS